MATVAPRPLLICQAVKDRLFPIKGAREVYYRAREVYKAYDAEDKIDIHEDYGPHSYAEAIRIGVIRFFDKHLKGVEPTPVAELQDFITAEHEESEVLHAFPGGKLPKGTETLPSLYGKLCDPLPRVKRPRTKAAYKAYRTQVLRHLVRLAGPWPDQMRLDSEEFPSVNASWARIRPFAFDSERGVVIPSVLIEPRDAAPTSVIVYVHDSGKAHALELRDVETAVRGGAAVLAMDLRGTGETAGTKPGEASVFTLTRSIMLGRHISMMRAYDVMRGVDAVKAFRGYERLPITMWAEGEASMVALFAFALDSRIKKYAAADLLLTFKSKAGFKQSDYILPPYILLGGDVADHHCRVSRQGDSHSSGGTAVRRQGVTKRGAGSTCARRYGCEGRRAQVRRNSHRRLRGHWRGDMEVSACLGPEARETGDGREDTQAQRLRGGLRPRKDSARGAGGAARDGDGRP